MELIMSNFKMSNFIGKIFKINFFWCCVCEKGKITSCGSNTESRAFSHRIVFLRIPRVSWNNGRTQLNELIRWNARTTSLDWERPNARCRTNKEKISACQDERPNNHVRNPASTFTKITFQEFRSPHVYFRKLFQKLIFNFKWDINNFIQISGIFFEW